MRGRSPGSQDITCCCLGPPLLCFPPERSPSSCGVQTPCRPRHPGTAARHLWSHALDPRGKGYTSQKTVTSTLSSSSTVFAAEHRAWLLCRCPLTCVDGDHIPTWLDPTRPAWAHMRNTKMQTGAADVPVWATGRPDLSSAGSL